MKSPRGKAPGPFRRAVRGKGTRKLPLSWRALLGPCRTEPNCRVRLPPRPGGAPFRRLVPDLRGPVRRVLLGPLPPGSSEDEPGWAPQRLSSPASGPRGQRCDSRPHREPTEAAGRAGQAAGPPSRSLLPAPAPPHCASVGGPGRGCSSLPGRSEEGLTAAGAMACLAG